MFNKEFNFFGDGLVDISRCVARRNNVLHNNLKSYEVLLHQNFSLLIFSLRVIAVVAALLFSVFFLFILNIFVSVFLCVREILGEDKNPLGGIHRYKIICPLCGDSMSSEKVDSEDGKDVCLGCINIYCGARSNGFETEEDLIHFLEDLKNENNEVDKIFNTAGGSNGAGKS